MSLDELFSLIESEGGMVSLIINYGDHFVGRDHKGDLLRGWIVNIKHPRWSGGNYTGRDKWRYGAGYGPTLELALLEALGKWRSWQPSETLVPAAPKPSAGGGSPKIKLSLSDLGL